MTQIKTIGILSPSSSIIRPAFEAGVKILQDRGYHVVIHPQTYSGTNSDNQMAGTPQDKLAAYRDLINHPDVDIIMAAAGGNRSCFILSDLEQLTNRKPIMGFSDTTAILCLDKKQGLGSYFGPTVQTLGRMDSRHLNLTFSILENKPVEPIQWNTAQTIHSGTVTAPVFAATLSVLCALAGTKFFPDLNSHILLLEDIGEEFSHLDRMLWQLSQVINFTNLSGLIFGQFTDSKDTGRPYGENLDQMIKNYAKTLICPILTNAPFGHDNQIFPILSGKTVTLNATNRTLIL
ncbi:MAG: LD-carboxypeptidase [Alphaproteobacteria bacterium]|jgi:muramoyltetrapeptide carboxypeptidase|nr:LD-carboxypeptidase [Alphaproteobacteria bacterium]MCB1551669.1 LD-carboxypeptidase [Alphaproteobacteria bacterium]MCB9984828.1 LD-carboxypeptidase [Micavibrio sp.]HPQ51065.1 LD-carboxypeptidase [Alphaproteobacteria bacterium]HRK97220.1 LD-carboxypeptidase [Alphaproteobacteria bacterium]